MLQQFFGGKSWYKSLTAWGAIVFALGSQAVSMLCSNGILSPEVCASTVQPIVQQVGTLMMLLGIRRATTAAPQS